MRNEVPPLMSRPRVIFSFGGQIVTKLNAMSNAISASAIRRFRRPTSVAKYHPNSTNMPRPMKNVMSGLMEFPISDFQISNGSSSRFLQHGRHRRFFHLNLHVVCDFYNDRGLFYVRDEAMDPGVGHDSITGLQR